MPAATRNSETLKKRWKPVFLKALAECPDVSAACDEAGVGRTTAYRARQEDEEFAISWSDALDRSLDKIERALFRRACDADTTAAIFMLKSHRRHIYGDQVAVQHSGSIKHDPSKLSDGELADLASRLEAA